MATVAVKGLNLNSVSTLNSSHADSCTF